MEENDEYSLARVREKRQQIDQGSERRAKEKGALWKERWWRKKEEGAVMRMRLLDET